VSAVGAGVSPTERLAVEDLYARYAEVLDEGEIERWPELFIEDAEYLIVARENHQRGLPLALVRCDSRAALVDRVQAITRLSFYAPRVLRHLVSGLRVRRRTDRSFDAQANYAVFQTLADEETTVLSVGRYLDVIVAEGDTLAFARKVCVYDNPLVTNSLVYPL
jgi:3-phenylpropionate/cinnamic acid dioxygenase small subunit